MSSIGNKTNDARHFATPTRRADESSALDRRGFLRGAAAATLGTLGTSAAIAQDGTALQTPGDVGTDFVSAQLHAQTQNSQRWGAATPNNWVRPRRGADHNVIIVGGGQSGLAIAYGLKRKGVGDVQVIDQAEPGAAGIWRNIARMHQLRTPKTMAGPEQENSMLGYRAWHETLNGAASFDALDRIPRLAWADYLDWYAQVTDTAVSYRTRLIEVEPQGDMLRLHLEREGVRSEETTRKLVFANGYAGAGGANLPGFVRALPEDFWSHTSHRIDFSSMQGQTVAIIGAGSSAFDAAAVALESGAAEVHMFNRRPYVDYPGGSRAPDAGDRGHANVLGMSYELPDVIRWRNFVARDRRVASVPPDSLQRAVRHDNFRLHLEASLEDVEVSRGQVSARARGQAFRFDHMVAGTGYRIDLSAQAELGGIHDTIARWGDRYDPERSWSNDGAALYPYLGAGFEFLPRGNRGAEYLRNIHCFNLAGQLSYGIPVGDIPSTRDHPRLVEAIARDLYTDNIDVAAHRRFSEADVVPADAAPYARALG